VNYLYTAAMHELLNAAKEVRDSVSPENRLRGRVTQTTGAYVSAQVYVYRRSVERLEDAITAFEKERDRLEGGR
jgi:hypothetical protein